MIPAFGNYFYIHFRENKRKNRPISYSPDGRIILIDYESREMPKPKETWLCQITRETDKALIVEPLIPREL